MDHSLSQHWQHKLVQIQIQHWLQQMRPKLQLTFLGQTMPQYHFGILKSFFREPLQREPQQTLELLPNPFTKSGLTAGTAYDFYVRADCGSGSTSAYVATVHFHNVGQLQFVQIQQHWLQQMRHKLQLTFLGQTMPQYHFGMLKLFFSGAAATGTATDAGVTANPFTKSGLTAGTAYDFYVRADCGSGSTSAYVGPFTFTTLSTPGCVDPTALASANETSTSADLSWTENGTAALWDVEVVLLGSCCNRNSHGCGYFSDSIYKVRIDGRKQHMTFM